MCYIYPQQSETNMLLAIHRRLYRWYHEWRVRRLQKEIRHIEHDTEAHDMSADEMLALEYWLDAVIQDLRSHQAKLAALFPQPTTER